MAIFLFFIFSLCFVFITGNCTDSEFDFLLRFYEETNGDGWIHQQGWNTMNARARQEMDCCSFYGVNCIENNSIWISLPDNNLSGKLPVDFSLTRLEFLNLKNNGIGGIIPDSIGNLTLLTGILLNNNNLSGSIPKTLSNLSNLLYLDLSYNGLNGTIPVEVGNLFNLDGIWLQNNQFTRCDIVNPSWGIGNPCDMSGNPFLCPIFNYMTTECLASCIS